MYDGSSPITLLAKVVLNRKKNSKETLSEFADSEEKMSPGHSDVGK